MRHVVLVVVGVLMSVGPLGAADPEAPVTARAQSGSTGRTLYMDHCASCHGADGRGTGPAADSLRRPPTNLARFAQDNGGVFPVERLRRVVDGRGVGAHGSVEMPVWGSVFKAATGDERASRARIDAIVEYLRALQERAGDER